MPDLATIGYQNATLPEVIATPKAAGVEVLVDVRAVAAPAAPALRREARRHRDDAGDPCQTSDEPRGRASHGPRCRHRQRPFKNPPNGRVSGQTISERRAALLCFEADAVGCPRRVVAGRLHQRPGVRVRDL